MPLRTVYAPLTMPTQRFAFRHPRSIKSPRLTSAKSTLAPIRIIFMTILLLTYLEFLQDFTRFDPEVWFLLFFLTFDPKTELYSLFWAKELPNLAFFKLIYLHYSWVLLLTKFRPRIENQKLCKNPQQLRFNYLPLFFSFTSPTIFTTTKKTEHWTYKWMHTITKHHTEYC